MSIAIPEYFAVTSLALFSFSDLRYRLVPGIEAFFLAAVLIGAPAAPLNAALMIAACAWGCLDQLPGFLVLPLLFYPPAWPVLLTAYGVRHGLIGRADLLAVAGLACLFPWPALVMAMLALEFWRRWWVRRQVGPVPAIPGLLLGILAYLLLHLSIPAA
jgi:hypothetical protein